jgi:hypothetical protein
VGKNSTQLCYGTNDKYNQTRYWIGYHDGLRDGKKGVGGEYDNINRWMEHAIYSIREGI